MTDQIIVLGGNSPKNVTWATELTKLLAHHMNTYMHRYQHWDSDSPADIDFQDELGRLTDYLGVHTEPYYMFTKSAGALLALQGIAQGKLTPKALVCVGLPLAYAEHRHVPLQEIIAANAVPALFIQAEHDPAGSASDVESLVSNHGSFTSVPGDDHNYEDTDRLTELATKFFM